MRRGERVQRFEALDGIDRPRLRELLEACFGRRLDGDYFDKKAFYRVYLSEAYTATAIITRGHALPVPMGALPPSPCRRRPTSTSSRSPPRPRAPAWAARSGSG